jgi:hypothetical protein
MQLTLTTYPPRELKALIRDGHRYGQHVVDKDPSLTGSDSRYGAWLVNDGGRRVVGDVMNLGGAGEVDLSMIRKDPIILKYP